MSALLKTLLSPTQHIGMLVGTVEEKLSHNIFNINAEIEVFQLFVYFFKFRQSKKCKQTSQCCRMPRAVKLSFSE